jgi:hypothetical protein
MIRTLFLLACLVQSSKLFSQRIIRSSIGTIGSSNKGVYSFVSGSPISSPIIQKSNPKYGFTFQAKPFIHLNPNFNVSKIEVTIYPNPSTDVVYVQTSADYMYIKVTDISGRICFYGTEPKLSLGHLISGVYTIEIYLPDNNTYSQKLILNK